MSAEITRDQRLNRQNFLNAGVNSSQLDMRMHMLGNQVCKQVGHHTSGVQVPANASVCNPQHFEAPKPPSSTSQFTQCSKRQLLMGAASIMFAPLLAQQAQASSPLYSITDSFNSALDGFDGVGGSDADYATAEVIKPGCGLLLLRCCQQHTG